jgi:hypothetical protein
VITHTRRYNSEWNNYFESERKYKTELRAQSKEAYNVLQLIFKIPKKLINYNAVKYTNNSLLTVSLF